MRQWINLSKRRQILAVSLGINFILSSRRILQTIHRYIGKLILYKRFMLKVFFDTQLEELYLLHASFGKS